MIGMSEVDTSVREHVHIQNYPIRLDVNPYAPSKSQLGRATSKFSVGSMQYVPGMGWDNVNPLVKGNDFIMTFYYKVKAYEMLGYEHVGNTSAELKRDFKSNWGEFPDG